MTPAEFRTAREAMGATQTELGAMMGVLRGVIGKLEKRTDDVPAVYALAMDALTAAHKEIWK